MTWITPLAASVRLAVPAPIIVPAITFLDVQHEIVPHMASRQPLLWGAPNRTDEFGEPSETPGVRTAAVVLARAIAETLSGRRPLASLDERLSDDARAAIESVGRRRRRPRSVVAASVRIQQPLPDAAEVTIRLAHDGRSSAAALRLVRCPDETWWCSALVVGPM